jgi:hypothetical protein
MASIRGVFAQTALALALLTAAGPAPASFVRAPRAPAPASDYILAAVPVAGSDLAIVRALSMIVAIRR